MACRLASFNNRPRHGHNGCRMRSLPALHQSVSVRPMSVVAEIESAIEKLSHPELSELARWFEEYQGMISASAVMFDLYDREEEESCRQPSAENCG
jgi:hypothetical protein